MPHLNQADYLRLTTRDKYEYHRERARAWANLWKANRNTGTEEEAVGREHYYFHLGRAKELRLKLDVIDNNTGRKEL